MGPPAEQNYGMELEQVQQLYEKQKHDPPISRNLPPVAGNITWSRWEFFFACTGNLSWLCSKCFMLPVVADKCCGHSHLPRAKYLVLV